MGIFTEPSMKVRSSLAQLCAACDVKRSGHRAWVKVEASPRERADAALPPRIRAVFAERPAPTGSISLANQCW